MKRKLLDNAIIIDGEVHQLVYDKLKDECEKCSLKEFCNCELSICFYFDKTGRYNFQKIGTIDDVLAKEQHRKEARHHLAVLIQHKRWLEDGIYKEVSERELEEAYDFIIQEIKKLYK